jgi:hypothetical protein
VIEAYLGADENRNDDGELTDGKGSDGAARA